MSKRSASSTPQKSKRAKLDVNQPRLDSFFKSPKPKTHQTEKLNKNASDERRVIDVDSLDTEANMPKSQNESSTDSGRIKSEAPESPSRITIGKTKFIASPAPETFPVLDIDPTKYVVPDRPSLGFSKAPYSLLAHALVTLSQTRSRIAIINTLTNLLRTIIANYPTSLLPAVYLLSNSLTPPFVSVELGLGSSVISRAIQQISGLSPSALRKLYNSTGDPGDMAFAAKSNLRTLIPHPPLTIPYVYESLMRISLCKGQGAAKEKQKITEKLLLAATGEEVRYLTRTLCQNLRVGAVRTSILSALSRAMVMISNSEHCNPLHPTLEIPEAKPRASTSKGKSKDTSDEQLIQLFKQAESLIKQVYAKHPSYDQIIPALLDGGLDGLAERVPFTVGIPLLPMLGSPTRAITEIYERLGTLPFTAEFKYDGQRAQVHGYYDSDKQVKVKIFSRHLEDMTSKYPDVVSMVNTLLAASQITSFIVDAEIVAIDPSTGTLKSFQELSNRARKDVDLKDVQVSVCLFAFDLMYLNEKPLLECTFRERRALLRNTFTPQRNQGSPSIRAEFNFVESCDSEEGKDVIEEFLTKAIENRCEGLMIKLLDKAPTDEGRAKRGKSKSLPSTYEPDIRTSAWLKLKKDYVDGMGDSLDLIPIGAWHGNGRKSQWWSPVLLALWNPDTGRPVAVCKCMSGFTDSFYKTMKERYSPDNPEACSLQPNWGCDFGGFKPDVYFNPQEVWEIRGADITESPVSIAAKGLASSNRGLSIRFPRFIRVREDKHIENANPPSFLADMWRKQEENGRHGAGNDDGDLMDVLNSQDEYFSDEVEEEL